MNTQDPGQDNAAHSEFYALFNEARGTEAYSEDQKREFADRIETTLDRASSHPTDSHIIVLHLLCAHVLGELDPRSDPELLNRILQHLNAIRLDPKTPNSQAMLQDCSELRATAWLKFGDMNDPSYFDLALSTFQDALTYLLPDGDPIKIGTLEYNLAKTLVHAHGKKVNTDLLERAEQHMRQAVHAYKKTGDSGRQSDAKHALSRILLEKLKGDQTAKDEKLRVFEEAWRLAEDSLTNCQQESRNWLYRNSTAAELLELKPDGLGSENLLKSTRYLENCLTAALFLREEEYASTVAAKLCDIMTFLPGPWPDELADRFKFYLDKIKEPHDQEREGPSPSFFWKANAYWVAMTRVGNDRRSEILGRFRELARQEIATAQRAQDNFSVARILTFLGRSYVVSSGHAETAEISRRDLESALGYFRGALDAVPDDDGPDLIAWILALESDVLADLVNKHNQRYLLDECLSVLHRAIQFNSNAVRARIRINLAGMLFTAVRWDDETRKDDARRAITAAIDDCEQNRIAKAIPYLRQLARNLAEGRDVQFHSNSDGDNAGLWTDSPARLRRDSSEFWEFSDFKEALNVAVDASRRRRFLSEFIAELPDYSSDRIEVIRAPFYESNYILDRIDRGLIDTDPVLSELSKLEIEAIKSTIMDDRECLNKLIKEDRKKNSNKVGKKVVGDFLRSGSPFILLLKAFSLEVPLRTLHADPSDRDPFHNYSDPRMRWRITTLRPNSKASIFARVGEILNPAGALLTVANVHDFFPPENIQRIMVSDVEWRRVVFSLAVEAAVILLFLPATSYYNLQKSLMEEMQAIELLDCKHKSIIVIAKDASSVDEHKGLSSEKMFLDAIDKMLERDSEEIEKYAEEIEKYTIELTAQVRGLGFSNVFSEQEVIGRPNFLLQQVSALIA